MAEGISEDYDANKEKSWFNEEFSRIQDDLSAVESNVKRLHNLEQRTKQAVGDQNEKVLAETKATLDRTITDLEETKAALLEAQMKSENLENRLLSQEMKLKAAKEETEMYKNSTVKVAKQKFEIEAQCIEKEKALNTSVKALKQLEGKFITTQQKLVQTKEELLKSENERDMFKSKCAKLDRQNCDLESKCNSLETTLEETKMSLEKAQRMLQMKEEEIEEEREMFKKSRVEWVKQKDELESKCTRTERALEKAQTELEDTKGAWKSEQHVCRVMCKQKDDQSCFCREYMKKVEELLTGIAGLVDCFCHSKTVMHQPCESGIEEGRKQMDNLKQEVTSLTNTLEGLSFKHPEAKMFLREEVKNEQDSLMEYDEKVDSVVKKLHQLKERISEWEKQRNLPVDVDSETSGSISSNSHNASVPKIESAYGDVAVVTEHMRACSDTSKEMDGHNEDLKGKNFRRLQSYMAEIQGKDDEIKEKDEELKGKDEELKEKDEELKGKDEELKGKDEEIGELRSRVVMLEKRQAETIENCSWTGATCRAPHQKTIRVFFEFYKEEILSKMEVGRLGEKLCSVGILPESLLMSIKDVEDTLEANVMFFDHAIKNYHFTACITLCDAMRSVRGYPKMNQLGEEMWKELETNQEEYEGTHC